MTRLLPIPSARGLYAAKLSRSTSKNCPFTLALWPFANALWPLCSALLTVGQRRMHTAQYQPQSPLVFERGTAPLNTNKLVAHIGTIIISTDGNQLFHPNLVKINLSTSFGFTGPITWSNNWQTGEPEYTVMETYLRSMQFPQRKALPR
ncbi:MAG: hypothetical protein LHW59_09155 [Candidatus Cloacimonetes bacterium]|nr:hypothetical protein [Candidatus Cloacimonadota bacterium]